MFGAQQLSLGSIDIDLTHFSACSPYLFFLADLQLAQTQNHSKITTDTTACWTEVEWNLRYGHMWSYIQLYSYIYQYVGVNISNVRVLKDILLDKPAPSIFALYSIVHSHSHTHIYPPIQHWIWLRICDITDGPRVVGAQDGGMSGLYGGWLTWAGNVWCKKYGRQFKFIDNASEKYLPSQKWTERVESVCSKVEMEVLIFVKIMPRKIWRANRKNVCNKYFETCIL